MALIIMEDHKLMDLGRRIGLMFMVYLNTNLRTDEIAAFCSHLSVNAIRSVINTNIIALIHLLFGPLQ